jgi:hypothetical protein
MVNFIKNGDGAEKTPMWLTLRLFIKMIDAVEGDDWKDLEKSIGSYNFEMLFELFNEFEQNDEIYDLCVSNFFTGLMYNIYVLFNAWVIFIEIRLEETKENNDINNLFDARIKKASNSGLDLFIKTKRKSIKNKNADSLNLQYHCLAKAKIIQMLNEAKNNYFFTFNYTKTLEIVYNINDSCICHIHGTPTGKSDSLKLEELVFGHGNDMYDSNVTNTVSTAYNVTKKPVSQCIINNSAFFEKLRNINNVNHVLNARFFYVIILIFSLIKVAYISDIL